jgi:hypothetical protein
VEIAVEGYNGRGRHSRERSNRLIGEGRGGRVWQTSHDR